MAHLLKSALLFLALATLATAAENPELAKLFTQRSLDGTLLISSLDGKTEYIHNQDRSEKRFLPASTFKIPNTLIALDRGAIAHEKEIIPWDGKDKGLPQWNQDQTLETAFPASCVWFYQELAKRIGNDAYLVALKQLGYGNRKTGPEITRFWLDGDLRISAREQITFLKQVYREDLPFKKAHIRLLKQIMIVEQTPGHTIRAKTGWAMQVSPQIGWYVGYVDTGEKVWFFAVNLDIAKEGDAAFRKQITMEALKLKQIL